jgi:hypothetical protein
VHQNATDCVEIKRGKNVFSWTIHADRLFAILLPLPFPAFLLLLLWSSSSSELLCVTVYMMNEQSRSLLPVSYQHDHCCYQAPTQAHDNILIFLHWLLLFYSSAGFLSEERRVRSCWTCAYCSARDTNITALPIALLECLGTIICTLFTLSLHITVYTIHRRPLSVQTHAAG